MAKKEKPKRESGLKRLNPTLRTSPADNFSFEELEAETTCNYEEFKNEYSKLREKRKKKVAYLVWFKDRPELNFISFQVETDIRIDRARDRARAEANRYLRNTYSEFANKQSYYDIYMMSRGKRIAQFDKYAERGKVPIRELLSVGFKYPCAFCHKHNFTIDDYENHRCYIIENEYNLNPFTDGIIICYNCYKALTK